MAHWRQMTDAKYLFFYHLEGKDCTLEIEKVQREELIGEGGRKANKPTIYFKGKNLPYAAANTSCKTIEQLYGPDPTKWVGKRITIYPTTTMAKGGETVGCIRVRPWNPDTKKEAP